MGACGSKQLEGNSRGMSTRPTSQFSTTDFPLNNPHANGNKEVKIQQNPTVQNGFNVILENIRQQMTVGVDLNTDMLRSVSSQVVTVSHHGTEQQRKLMCAEFLPRLIAIFEERSEMAGREAIIRAISQLARCSRGDAHRLHAAKHHTVVSLALAVITRGCRTEWSYVCMHGCDLLRYLLGNEEDCERVKQMGAVKLLSGVIGFSTQLDADNELVKSAFQALLAIGPDGSGDVFEVVVDCMREYFFHSSVVTPALASLMAMSSEPQGAIRVMEHNLIPPIKKALELHQNSTTMRAYGKRIFTNINHFMAMQPQHAQMYFAQVHNQAVDQPDPAVDISYGGTAYHGNPREREKGRERGRERDTAGAGLAADMASDGQFNDSVNVQMNDSMHMHTHTQETPQDDSQDAEGDYGDVMSPVVVTNEALLMPETATEDVQMGVVMSGQAAMMMNNSVDVDNEADAVAPAVEMEVGVHPARMLGPVDVDYEDDDDAVNAEEVVQI